MRKLIQVSEYIETDDGTEVCPECGHIWNEEGAGHYHDCRYFLLEDQFEESQYDEEDLAPHAQMSLFRPAA